MRGQRASGRRARRCDGEKIARLREERGYSQHDLADKAGRSKSSIERIERGQAVDYQTVHDVAAVLDIPFDEMLSPEERAVTGPGRASVPLTPVGSARELMDLLLRCDRCSLDVLDDPDPSLTGTVVRALRQLEKLTPGSARVDRKVINAWRDSAADRLRGLARLQACLEALAGAGFHLLAGDYRAFLDDEVLMAAPDYIDILEPDHLYAFPSPGPEASRQVGFLRVAKRSRTSHEVTVDDLFTPEPATDDGESPS